MTYVVRTTDVELKIETVQTTSGKFMSVQISSDKGREGQVSSFHIRSFEAKG